LKAILSYLSFCIFIFGIYSNAHSQSQFQVLIGGTSDDEARCVIQTRDNGYAVAGYTRNFGAGNSDVYVIKLSQEGLIEWTVTAGGSNNDIAHSMVQTSDGGYLIGAESRSFLNAGTNIYIIKLNSGGQVQWEKIISGFAAGSYSNDFLYSVIETKDSTYMISASTINVDAEIGGVQLIELSQNGTVLWFRIYDRGGRHLIQTSDGGYALGGSAENSMSALKLDNNGNVQWCTAVGGIPQDVARSIIQADDGGYVLAGETKSYGSASGNMYVVKLDSAGTLQWTRYVGGSSSGTVAREVVQTFDGGYAVAGYIKITGESFNTYLVKLNADGEVQWSRIVGTNSLNEFGMSMKQTSDSGYIIAGYRFWFNSTVYILKFDKDGNTCGNMTSHNSPNGIGGMVFTPTVINYFANVVDISPPSTISSSGNYTLECLLVGTGNQYNELPSSFELSQNYPNPFNPSTIISYSLPVNSDVTLKVFDILGKEVAVLFSGNQNAGKYNVEWNAERLASGIYFYELRAVDYIMVKRMLLVK
jgi:hypothetical protein